MTKSTFNNPLHVIAIDDEDFNLELVKALSEKIHPNIITFTDAYEALEHIKKHPVDIMLVDYMMPELNGIELMLKALSIKENILTIMITAIGDDEAIKVSALDKGAIDFLKKPLNAAEFKARMKNVSKLKRSQHILDNFNQQLQKEVKKATKALVQREKEALRVLSNTAEYKDPETASHVARVAHYSKLLALAYGLDEYEQEIIFNASPLHDIGKVGISDATLLKPDKLNAQELQEMKEHPLIGMKILESSENPFLKAGAIISYTHHEKYDGSGYPNALVGDEIHIYGRISALADVFDALTSIRPYKKAWSFEDAFSFIQEQSGSHFDPRLCELFLQNRDKVKAIYEEFQA